MKEFCFGLWLITLTVSLFSIYRYLSIPTDVVLSAEVQLVNDDRAELPDQHQLYVFYWPDCGCTQATLRELARLQPYWQQAQSAVELIIVYKAESALDEQERQGISDILGVVAFKEDFNNALHTIYGVKTSGHIVYESPNGCLFSGGITKQRGHEGGNGYQETLLSCIKYQVPMGYDIPVYGCEL